MAENFAELGKAALSYSTDVHHNRGHHESVLRLSSPCRSPAALGVIPTMLMAGQAVSIFALIGLIMLV